jgi:hypothetical protein
MSTLTNFQKKLVYGLMIVALFGAMFPYRDWLNREKRSRDLGEAAIGQIDTGSFMMKLFLLGGFRGIVADLLWVRADEYKRAHDWDKLASTVDLITKLQPHFLSIWTYQGWNLAYNVSVEWDAPEDKYQWIKKGIQFVQEGVKKNKKSPDLLWDTAWFYYHKLGFSDESIILRRLFRDDEDREFKTYYDPDREAEVEGDDNFKLGYGWFSRAVSLVDEGASRVISGTSENVAGGGLDIVYVDPTPQRKGRPEDIAFRSMPAHGQTRYAAGLEKMSVYGIPAVFGEKAKNEWAVARNEWQKLGDHVFMSHNEVLHKDGKFYHDPIRLDDITNPERFNNLSENEKHWTDRWSNQMNYRYWKMRCQAEQTDNGVRARQLFYEGTLAYKMGDFPKAVDRFKQGLESWKLALNDFPAFRDDELSKKETGLIVKRYLRVLKQLGAPVPNDLPFKDTAALAENDNTVDPFDAIEMIGASAANPGGAPAAKP